jgi:excisionase family DNA binding protein
MSSPDALLTLDEAAKLIPGADAGTLKRLARNGRLTVYRLGKSYSTTAADVREAIAKCRVAPKDHVYGSVLPVRTVPLPHGSSLMERGNAVLASALAQASKKNPKRSART